MISPRLLVVFVLVVLCSSSVFALEQLLSLQGKVVDSNGALVERANITVMIFDSPTGGALVYNSTTNYNGNISNGFFDLALGEITDLKLNLSANYYMDLMIDNEDVDWNGQERRQFQSAVGYDVGGSDNFTIDTALLFIDTLNNRIGVGTSLPGAELDVVGNINVTGIVQATTFIGDGSQLTGIGAGFSNGSDINVTVFVANNTLYVNGSRVGIGTTNLTAALSLGGSTTGQASFTIEAGSQPTSPKPGDLYSDGTDLFFYDGTGWQDLTSASAGGGFTDDGTVVRLSTSTDLVGIGTTNPTEKLAVTGNASIVGDLIVGGNLLSSDAVGSSGPNVGWLDEGSLIRLVTSTDRVAIGASSGTARLTVEGNVSISGNVTPGANNTYSLGTPDLVWKDVYVGNESLYIGGIALSSGGGKLLFGGEEVTTSATSLLQIAGTVNASNFTLANVCSDGQVLKFQNGFAVCGDDSTSSGAGEIGGEGTTGYLAVFNASSVINESVIFQDSNDNIGIGTSSPTQKLTVVGQSSITGGIVVNDTLFVNGSRVGIGTSSPGIFPPASSNNADSRVLDIRAQSGSHDAIINLGRLDSSTIYGALWYDGNGGDLFFDNGFDHLGGEIRFRTRTSNTPVDALTIIGTGEVGIGNTIPNNTLDVSGDANITGTASFGTAVIKSDAGVPLDIESDSSVSYIDIDNHNTGTSAVRLLDTGSARWIVGSDGSDSDKFKISASSTFSTSNVVTIDRSSESVGIGTTNPSGELHVNASGEDTTLRIEGDGTTFSQELLFKDEGSDWYVGNRYSGDANGFGIGTTNAKSTLIIGSSGLVSVNREAGSGRLSVQANSWSENALALYSSDDGGNNDHTGIAFFNSSGSNVADIYTGEVDSSLSLTSETGIHLKYGSSGISGGTSSLYVRGSDGNIGIKTSTAATTLTLPTTSSRLSWGTIPSSYSLGSSGGGAILFGVTGDSEYIAFETHESGVAHAERVRIAESGDVGIGTSSPTKKLEISDSVTGLVVDPSATNPTINTTSPGGNAKNLTLASEDGSVVIQLG